MLNNCVTTIPTLCNKTTMDMSNTTDPTQNYQLSDEGVCISCDSLSLELEVVQCGVCDKKFHAVCTSCPADAKWATKTTIQSFKTTSTKRNFKFLCDHCLTEMETKRADGEGLRIRKMEENMKLISKELLEIKNLLMPKKDVPNTAKPTPSSRNTQNNNSIWFDTEKLATVKAKPAESVLVINTADNADIDKSNATVVENIV